MAAPVEKGTILAQKYRVEDILGEGGMGVVVAAQDTTLERMVAIKFLLPEYAQHEEAAARFMREARAAVKIQSEHIARVIDVGTMDNGSPYMVMEFLHGEDLSQLLSQRGTFPVEEAVGFVMQACDAIAEAHAAGIVHRDLKPANLFLAQQPDGSSKIKVLDFGISKNTLAVADGTDPSLTRTSSMMGSPLYMSPEQMRSTKDVDARTDIWSLAVILYELLEGELPFNATSIPELSAKILLEQPQTISRVDVPVGLKQAINKALDKNPSNRFPSVAEFTMALSDYGPRRMRNTLERISRLMVSAGMSEGGLQLQATEPPPSMQALSAKAGAIGGLPNTGSQGEEHLLTGTSAGWGHTHNPDSGGGPVRWVLSGVAAFVVLAGAGALIWHSSQDPEAASGSAVASPELRTTIEDSSRLPRDTARQPEAMATVAVPKGAPGAGAPSGIKRPGSEYLGRADTQAPATSEAAPAATPPATSEAAPAATPPAVAKAAVRTKASPKKAKSRVARSRPKKTKRPEPSVPKSIKDKFGGRK